MIIRSAIVLSALALPLFAAPAFAGPCSQQIYDFNVVLNKRLDAGAAAGRAAPESLGATMHRQPTPQSVERAEAELGDLSPANAQAISEAMALAHKADDAGDRAACEKAVGEAQQILNR